MAPGSITTATVQLLNAANQPIAQAAGSPSLSANGRVATIVPAATLGEPQNYRIRVIGGSSGVTDVAGNRMASTYTQSNGFTIANQPPGTVGNVRREDTR